METNKHRGCISSMSSFSVVKSKTRKNQRRKHTRRRMIHCKLWNTHHHDSEICHFCATFLRNNFSLLCFMNYGEPYKMMIFVKSLDGTTHSFGTVHYCS